MNETQIAPASSDSPASAEAPDLPAAPVEDAPARTLAAALVRARRDCPPTVFKAGRNKDQNYRFVGHEQVLVSGARAALLRHGLVLEQQSVEYVGSLLAPSRSGERPVWRWCGTFVLLYGASGEERLYRYEATTQPNDKAAYVASTALDRVALLRVLQLAGSDEENPEHDSHDESARRDAPPAHAGSTRHTLPAPGGAPPPGNQNGNQNGGQLALVRGQGARAPHGGEHPEQVDLEHAAKQATYNRLTRQLAGRKQESALSAWLVEVMAERLADDLKQALWIAFAEHCHAFGFNPQVLKASAQKTLRGAP